MPAFALMDGFDLDQKGTALHAATVVGDTVGDPFKDTSSVALNPIIKFSTLFGLLAVEIAITIKQAAAKGGSVAGDYTPLAGAALLLVGHIKRAGCRGTNALRGFPAGEILRDTDGTGQQRVGLEKNRTSL